jgi:conjugative transfer region protein TrbK
MLAVNPIIPAILVSSTLLLIVGACTIQLRPAEDAVSTSMPAQQGTDPMAARLEECRTVTADQTATLDECRRIWTENRRRFFDQRSGKPAESSGGAAPSVPTESEK